MLRRTSWMTLIGLLLLAVPRPGLAGTKPVYAYVEAGYNEVDVDNLAGANDEGNGAFAGISIGFFKYFHAFGRYVTSNTDLQDIDITDTIVGGGWHGLLGEKADLIGEVAWIEKEIDPAAGSKLDGSGYFGRAGARWRPIKLVEIGGWVRFQDLGDDLDSTFGSTFDSTAIYEANAMFQIWGIGVGLAIELEDDVETYNAFARFNFGG